MNSKGQISKSTTTGMLHLRHLGSVFSTLQFMGECDISHRLCFHFGYAYYKLDVRAAIRPWKTAAFWSRKRVFVVALRDHISVYAFRVN